MPISQTDTRIALNDKQIAENLGMSVAWVRKDRRTKRSIPFFRIGDCIRYDWDRVRQSLLAREEGGSQIKSRATGSTA